jgi:hypothetical protein
MKTVKKDPPSFIDVIKAALLANPATSGLATLAGAAVNEGKERLAENLKPYGYKGSIRKLNEHGVRQLHLTSPKDRIINALMGESEYSQDELNSPSEAMKERKALFRSVLGLGGDGLPASEYMDDAYRSPVTEKFIKNILNDPQRYYSQYSNTPKSKQLMSDVIDQLVKEPQYVGAGGYNTLGTFSLNRGSDDRGDYIDYYDEWDLNPFTDNLGGKPDKNKRKIEDFFYDDVFRLNTPKVYGRVYMDELIGGDQEVPKLLDRLNKSSIYG